MLVYYIQQYLLHRFGFRAPKDGQSDTKTPIYMLYFADLSYIHNIKWALDIEIIQRKPNNIDLLDLCKQFDANIGTYDKRYRWLTRIFDIHDTKNSRGHICMDRLGISVLDKMDDLYWTDNDDRIMNKQLYMIDRYEIFFYGFLKSIMNAEQYTDETVPSCIFKLCQNYYHPLMDLHRNQTHLTYLSVDINTSKFDLSLYDIKLDDCMI